MFRLGKKLIISIDRDLFIQEIKKMKDKAISQISYRSMLFVGLNFNFELFNRII